LAQRQAVYRAAKQTMPERWQGRDTRNWQPVGSVWFNPEKPSSPNVPSMPQTT